MRTKQLFLILALLCAMVQGARADDTYAYPTKTKPEGGALSSAEGTFTADYMEGWTKTEHAKGVGNAHIISPPRDFEGGGDEAEYFGKETGKLVLTGHAWAVQENNTLKSGRLTVFLKDRSNTETVTNEEGKEEQ